LVYDVVVSGVWCYRSCLEIYDRKNIITARLVTQKMEKNCSFCLNGWKYDGSRVALHLGRGCAMSKATLIAMSKAREKRRRQMRSQESWFRYGGGVSSLMCFGCAFLWFSIGLWALGIIMVLIGLQDGTDLIKGRPQRPGRSKHSPLYHKESHIPDCPDCNGYGRKSRGFASGLIWRVPFYECPLCLGSGKERHKDNEWYYDKKDLALQNKE